MKGSEIRSVFLKFFEERGHTVYPSDSLVPTNDPSLLFTGAGMNQFKDAFLGRSNLTFKRAATSQKCIRTGDIENVGRTPSHHTFFEMLGNFSFGDYFKREAIEWAWEFVTGTMKLPESKLCVSVYKDDDEAHGLWRTVVGLPDGKIYRLGEHDNFWPADAPSLAPEGMLCGPCSEIFFDWGAERGCGSPDCSPACDCRRYVEIWNLVFQQFEKGAAAGELRPLSMQNIDTGMGLERITAVMQGVYSNFDTDIFKPLVNQAAEISGRKYGESPETDSRLRRIADHARAVAFMIADGVLPSNDGRGYVVRRLLRRALLDGRRLGIDEPFVHAMTPTVAMVMGVQYPEVRERGERIAEFIKGEEERFGVTLNAGLGVLDRFAMRLTQGQVLDGKSVFTLYDTYGFPFELTEEVMAERGIAIDHQGFADEMAAARERSRGGVTEDIFGYAFMKTVKERTRATAFVGYEANETDAVALALVTGEDEGGAVVNELPAGEGLAQVVLDRTPFYAESGGQVGDAGTFRTASGAVFRVEDTRRAGEIFLHRGRMVAGTLRAGEAVHAEVDVPRRIDIARNHTATHLLHHELRSVLGPHVEQAGSLVEGDYMRLDFSHGQALTREEIDRVELAVNERVWEDEPVTTESTSVEEARKRGAMALFGEKYGGTVRMVTVGESKELCGGTHLGRTGEIGLFRIVSEESVAAGVRRVTGRTGRAAYRSLKQDEAALQALARELKVSSADVVERVRTNAERVKKLERELKETRRKAMTGGGGGGIADLASQAVEIAGVKVVAVNLGEATADDLRAVADTVRPKLEAAGGEGAVLALGGATDGKAALGVWVLPKALQSRVKAGRIVKAIAPVVGGGGGGRDDSAQAGGKDPSKLDEALAKVADIVREAMESAAR